MSVGVPWSLRTSSLWDPRVKCRADVTFLPGFRVTLRLPAVLSHSMTWSLRVENLTELRPYLQTSKPAAE